MASNDVVFDIWKKEGVKYVNVRRFKDGKDIGFVDIPLPDLEATLKRHPEWVVLGPVGNSTVLSEETLPKVAEALQPLLSEPATPGIAVFECPLCDKQFPTSRGLAMHKRKAH